MCISWYTNKTRNSILFREMRSTEMSYYWFSNTNFTKELLNPKKVLSALL